MKLLLLAMLGCPSALKIDDSLPEHPLEDYAPVHEQWTRSMSINQDFETRVLIKATLVTEEVARVQTLTLARARLENESAYQERLQRSTQEASEHWVLYFSANAPPPKFADSFAVDGSADWQLHLEADGRRVSPVDLERVWEPSADDHLLWLQMDRWSKLYKVRFERPADADSLRLLVAGPYGRGQLEWDLSE